ncbi:MAG: long-chain fatty acid--CoA ligase [Alphaproteobacteria bacterium]|nr:long-chain fatty acid--CoA ligase [Alphaproteobacteria bacterium]
MADGSATAGTTAAAHGLPDTFPKLLERNAREFGDRPSIREKDYGIWQTWTWKQVHGEVREFAAGLASLGVRRGHKVAIVGDNRPQLYWSMCAAQMLGAVPVPVYQDSVAEEMGFVIDHAEADFAIAEDQEQVDKLLVIRGKHKRPGHIVYKDPRGMRDYNQPGIVSLAEVAGRGAEFQNQHPGFLDAEIAKGRGSDVSVMLYTSGTTGQPKGVMLSYDNVIVSGHNGIKFDGLTRDDEVLAYLPMAWVGDHIYSYGESFIAGFCLSCPESGATVLTDLREIGPTFFFAPPRIFENLLTTVSIRMEDAGWLKRSMYKYFMEVARRAGIAILDKRPVSAADRFLYWLGGFLVYAPLKNALGFSRIRLGYTAGEAIGPDIFDFYRSLGLNLKQLYGMTETSVFICMQPDGQVKADTVGVPAPQVEIKIAESGEVLVKSPGVFLTYYKNDSATNETKTPDGWVHTGDAGFFDKDGHLKIIDRAKDVGRLRNGTLFAPKYIENKLKFFPYIKEAVAFGDGQDYVACFVNIDLEAVGNWAEKRAVSYGSYQELAAKPEVYDLLQECVEKVNRDLAADPNVAGSQIKRFLILHKELDADDGELTRTRKVRRRFIGDRYNALIDGLYSDRDRAHIKTTVTFEDGRTGAIEADLAIREAKRQPIASPAHKTAA